MQNAHERFGSLEFIKRTKDTNTRVRVHIDRAVLETRKDERGQASAHLISMIGGDSEILGDEYRQLGIYTKRYT